MITVECPLGVDSKVFSLIREWALAANNAHQNTEIMCGNATAKQSKECSERMSVLHNAKDAMLALEGQPNLPKPLQDFIDAENDKGCGSCWFSSIRSNNHHECNEKIHRWFRCREVLESYGLGIPPKHDVKYIKGENEEPSKLDGGGVSLTVIYNGELQNYTISRKEIEQKFGPKTLALFNAAEKKERLKNIAYIKKYNLDRKPEPEGQDPLSCDVFYFMGQQRTNLTE